MPLATAVAADKPGGRIVEGAIEELLRFSLFLLEPPDDLVARWRVVLLEPLDKIWYLVAPAEPSEKGRPILESLLGHDVDECADRLVGADQDLIVFLLVCNPELFPVYRLGPS